MLWKRLFNDDGAQKAPFQWAAQGFYLPIACYESILTVNQGKCYTNSVPSPPSLYDTQSGRTKKEK